MNTLLHNPAIDTMLRTSATTVVLVATACVAGGLAMTTWAAWRRGERRIRNLRTVLELQYIDRDGYRDPTTVSALLVRSGVLAEKALGRTSLWRRMSAVVERSDWRLSTGELIVVSAGLGVVGMGAGIGVGVPPLGALLALMGLFGPYAGCRRSVRIRMKRFEAQFPEILDMVAATLESGGGVQQALEVVVTEVDEPAASEFTRVLNATRLGTPLTDALQAMSERLGSRDVEWTVHAIVVQQRTGGRLAEVLRIVASVMRSRDEVRRELSALTAEGRLSAYVLTALPLLMGGFLAMFRREYLQPLYTTRPGIAMLVCAGLAMTVSFVAMKRIVRIEV